jgi:hypothetical protein
MLNLNMKTYNKKECDAGITSKPYDKIVKMPTKSHETLPLT